MERLTYVTENGSVLFFIPGTDGVMGYTITGLATDGKYMFLEDIAHHLTNVEQQLEMYLKTGLSTEQGMERLTKRIEFPDGTSTVDFSNEYVSKNLNNHSAAIKALFDKLAAYEDTGLSPEGRLYQESGGFHDR